MTELRPLESRQELRACVRLQQRTWGEGFSDIVPASVLQVSCKVGGFAGGAFDGERLVGFVYSLVGDFEGEPSHWSHMLAVRPSVRGRGLGRELKLFQREAVRRRGISTIFWTYDPLVARNAHLNLNRLGATVVRYVPNMYGSNTGSPLHGAGDTDRLIVRWDLDGPETRRALAAGTERSRERLGVPAPDPASVVPVSGRLSRVEAGEEGAGAGGDGGSGGAEDEPSGWPEGEDVFVEIPADMESLPAGESLALWRHSVRNAVITYLRRGYAVHSLVREREAGRCFYRLRVRPGRRAGPG